MGIYFSAEITCQWKKGLIHKHSGVVKGFTVLTLKVPL